MRNGVLCLGHMTLAAPGDLKSRDLEVKEQPAWVILCIIKYSSM